MTRILLALLVFGYLFSSSAAAEISSQMQEQLQRHPCNSVNPDRAISGCTNFIKGPEAHLESKAWAYAKRAKAYTKLGQYRSAIQDLDKALRRSHDSFHALQERGRTHFYLGNFAAATGDLDQVMYSRSKTSFDALWRYIALERAGGDGRTLLQNDATHFGTKDWPGPVMEMFLRRSDPETVLAVAMSNNTQLKNENLCEAYFYIGQYHLLRDEVAAAQNAFQQALDTSAYTFIEYRGAYEELRRLGQPLASGDPRIKILFPNGISESEYRVERDTALPYLGPKIQLVSNQDKKIPLTIFRDTPEYPRKAAKKGVEGWVLLQFTITEDGSVKDVEVLDSDPPGVFDRSATRALKKWKYAITQKDGLAIEMTGMQQIITYELD